MNFRLNEIIISSACIQVHAGIESEWIKPQQKKKYMNENKLIFHYNLLDLAPTSTFFYSHIATHFMNEYY